MASQNVTNKCNTSEGKVAGVREFCYSMTDSEWAEQSLEELVQLRLCPAYLVPQRPLFDRSRVTYQRRCYLVRSTAGVCRAWCTVTASPSPRTSTTCPARTTARTAATQSGGT